MMQDCTGRLAMETRTKTKERVVTINDTTRALNERNLRKTDVVHVYCGEEVSDTSYLDYNIRFAKNYGVKKIDGKTPEATARIKKILSDMPPREMPGAL
jgi:hypothetical protein